MKYNEVYNSELDDVICYKITIEDSNDYEMLSFIIVKGDVIEIQAINKILVNNVEYDNIKNTIKIYGYETNKIEVSLDEFNNKKIQKFDLSGNCQFLLYRNKYLDSKSCLINEQIVSYKEMKEKEKMISEENIQNQCFEILQQYIVSKPGLIIYGENALVSLKNESLKVLMISYDVFKRIDEKMREILKNINHKYKKTNIVFYDENSYYYNELMKYGGIIGVISEN